MSSITHMDNNFKMFWGVLIQNIELNLHQGPLLHDIPSDLYFQLFT